MSNSKKFYNFLCKGSLFLSLYLQITPLSAQQKEMRVTLDMEHVTLKAIFNEITLQTGFLFYGEVDQLDRNQITSIHVKNMPVRKVMEKLLAGRGATCIFKGN